MIHISSCLAVLAAAGLTSQQIRVQERAAKKGVVLPWEHSQAGCATQEELRPVALPGQKVAAGNADPTGAGKGFILYERDSDNDDVDSDEDPDDELDV